MPPTLSSGWPAHAASPVCRVTRMWPAPAWRSTASRSWESSCCLAASRPTTAPVEIALGKLLPPLLVASVQATLYLLIVTLLYGVPFRGNLLVFYTAVLTFAEACAGVGLFISSLVRTQQQAFLGAFAVLLPFALLSGFATPIENMPWWLQFLTTINPLAHMLRLMQGLFLKGASVASLAQDLLRLLEIALCTTAAAVLLFRRKAA